MKTILLSMFMLFQQQPPLTPQQKVSSLEVAKIAKKYCVELEHLTGAEQDKCELAVAIGFIAGEEYGWRQVDKGKQANGQKIYWWPQDDGVVTCSHWMEPSKDGHFRCD
jgi:hypothetical protein